MGRGPWKESIFNIGCYSFCLVRRSHICMKYQSTAHCTTSRTHVLGSKTSNRLRDSHWARLHSTWCEMALCCGKAQMAREKEAAALPPSELVHFESENRRRGIPYPLSEVLRGSDGRQDRSLQPDCSPLSTGKLSKLGRWTGRRDLAGPCHKAGGKSKVILWDY